MGLAQRLRDVNARLSRFAIEDAKTRTAGIGYPHLGWQPYAGWFSPTSTGVTVTSDMAMSVSAFYAGVRVISEDVASLPLILYRRNGRAKDRATDDPLYALLHDAPNPDMT